MDRRERQVGGRHPPEHGAEHDGYAPSHNIFDSDSYDAPVEKKYQEVVHFWLTIIHCAATIFALIFSVWIAVFAFNGLCNNEDCKSMIYITNTFFSTNKVGSVSGWAVATERAQLGEVVQYPLDRDAFAFSHYFECMDTAQMADSICGKTDSVGDYTTCLKNDTRTNAALTACNALSTSLSQPWPSSEEYLQCLFRFPSMYNSESRRASENVFRACLAKSMWPFFEVQQGIDTPLFLGAFNWIILLSVGLLCLTSFAVYTASPWELGKVNRGEPTYYMRMGTLWSSISTLWIFGFLVAFFVVAFRDGSTFETSDEGGIPTTSSTSVISILTLGAYFFYFLSELVDSRDYSYFIHVHQYVKNRFHKHNGYTEVPDGETDEYGKVTRVPAERKPHNDAQLGVPLPDKTHPQSNKDEDWIREYEISAVDVAKYYTPALLPAWADGMLADPCIFLGIAGASGHLTTDQAWNIFFLVLLYRFLNMLIARFMYQCFMNNLSLGNSVNKAYRRIVTHPQQFFRSRHGSDAGKNDVEQNGNERSSESRAVTQRKKEEASGDSPHLNIQVMALSTQIAAIFLLTGLCLIAFDPEAQLRESGTFTQFFIAAFLVPEIIRILGHVACQIRNPESNGVPWMLLNFYFFLWIYDIIIRVSFVSYVVLSLSSDPGTRRYLMEQSALLLDSYLPQLGVAHL